MPLVFNQVIEECDSTNRLGRILAEAGLPNGTWISSKKQSAGRGRMGREWVSSEGNLFLSVILRALDRSKTSWVPLSAAVAACKSIQSFFPDLNIGIKWPNDLWIDDRKVGGILCEGGTGTKSTENPYVVVGIGLNTRVASYPGSIALSDGVSTPSTKADLNELIRVSFIESLVSETDTLWKDGARRLAKDFEKFSVLPVGTEVQWGEPVKRGIVRGLGQMGELLVQMNSGERVGLFAEDVTKFRKASYGSLP